MRMFLRRLRPAACVALWLCTAAAGAPAQRSNLLHRAEKTATVLMLSDLHFDPLMDPGKFEPLQAAPPEGWRAILEASPSADQATAFANLQSKCKVRGADSSWSLVRNSLNSARVRAVRAAFAVVAGDLLVHEMDCRLHTLGPKLSEAEMSAFAAKTIAFLALEIHRMYPDMPVYFALGNNDSGCTDYSETPGSEFLKGVGESFAKAVPGNADAFASFSEYGDYSVPMPAPFAHGRLLVLQDDFLSAKYATCGGKKTLEPDKAQIEWLGAQLEKARAAKEHVWVMAHIPPGIDVYKSFHQFVLQPAKLCTVKTPSLFLHSDALTQTLASYSDVVELALFSHTHMDEVKLLHAAPATGGIAGDAGSVPAKLIPSISPINGNHPAFLLAQVSIANARMLDYTTYVTSDPNGTQWTKSYTFRNAYGATDFSAASVRKLTDDLRADRTGAGPVSRTYRQWFMPGDNGLIGLGLQQIWPAYSCSASESAPADFSRCMCPVQAAKVE